jgi:hypothetical protein
MANPNDDRFAALPGAARDLCAGAGLAELRRLCEPYLALHCTSGSGNEPAGEGPDEADTARHPDDERHEVSLAVRARLARFADWRRILAPDYVCDGGFIAVLAGVGAAGPRRWASEEHYVRASMLVAGREASRVAVSHARWLSLDSGHPLARAPVAAREFVSAGEGHLRDARGARDVYRRPAGLALGPAAYEIEALRGACWRAAVARFTQHALSRAVLLATERAVLTAHTAWAPVALNLSAMAVREMLRDGLPAPFLAGWWPVPAQEHEAPARAEVSLRLAAAALPGGGPVRAAPPPAGLAVGAARAPGLLAVGTAARPDGPLAAGAARARRLAVGAARASRLVAGTAARAAGPPAAAQRRAPQGARLAAGAAEVPRAASLAV